MLCILSTIHFLRVLKVQILIAAVSVQQNQNILLMQQGVPKCLDANSLNILSSHLIKANPYLLLQHQSNKYSLMSIGNMR